MMQVSILSVATVGRFQIRYVLSSRAGKIAFNSPM
jgi:hypothetical protein